VEALGDVMPSGGERAYVICRPVVETMLESTGSVVQWFNGFPHKSRTLQEEYRTTRDVHTNLVQVPNFGSVFDVWRTETRAKES
jgi:hypothetical protein